MWRLPWWSEFKKELDSDDEVAKQWAAQFELEDLDEMQAAAPKPSLQDWDPWRDLAANISDRLGEVIVATLLPHSKKGKKPTVKPSPRPKTARQAALDARMKALEQADADDIIAQMMGGE